MAATRLGSMVPTVFPQGAMDRRELSEYVGLAGNAGMSTLLVGDHINWSTDVLECFSLLGFLAGTSDLELAANVVIAPLRHPVHVAKMAQSIAHLSGRGFWLGVGVGGEHAGEFAAVDVDPRERGRRVDEAIDATRRLLESDGAQSHDGRFWRFRDVQLEPKHRVPILVGGRSDAALRRVVDRSDGWTSAWNRPAQFGARWTRILELAEAAGRPLSDLRAVAHCFVTLDQTEDAAWQVASTFMGSHYQADPTPFRSFCLLGPPSRIVEGLEAYRTQGADQVVVQFNSDDQLHQMEQFAKSVSPELGTDWLMEDPDAAADSPGKRAARGEAADVTRTTSSGAS